jgi:hypothetical protein
MAIKIKHGLNMIFVSAKGKIEYMYTLYQKKEKEYMYTFFFKQEYMYT